LGAKKKTKRVKARGGKGREGRKSTVRKGVSGGEKEKGRECPVRETEEKDKVGKGGSGERGRA